MQSRALFTLRSAMSVLLLSSLAGAQDATSRLIPFSLATTLPPSTTQDVVVELWDAATGGALIFSEAYTALPVDSSRSISFRFGSQQLPPGLNPAHFPSGSARYLDVTQGVVSVLSARLPLTAVAFALSPGPEGPPGPPGPSDVPANLTMVDSTATAGNLIKGGVPFLHNFGIQNTFLGANAGNLTMTGNLNTGNGASALSSNTTGQQNTAIGAQALGRNTIGGGNATIGAQALFSNTGGSGNTAAGMNALYQNTNGTWNTATGREALFGNTTGNFNTASGQAALRGNATGLNNTAIGLNALSSNTTGSGNTAIGSDANVSVGNLSNATAIGAGALVDASDKVRVGNTAVTVIEGQVGFTASSDRNKKENLKAVDGEKVLGKIRGLSLASWNFIGHDPKQFRHYGPMAQDFFAAFGDDGLGKIGTETTITSTDIDGILMVAAQALEKRTEALRAENADLKVRLEALERRIGGYALTRAE